MVYLFWTRLAEFLDVTDGRNFLLWDGWHFQRMGKKKKDDVGKD